MNSKTADPIGKQSITFSRLEISSPTNAGKSFGVENREAVSLGTEGEYHSAFVVRTEVHDVDALLDLALNAKPLEQWTAGWNAEHETFTAVAGKKLGRNDKTLPFQPSPGLMVLDCDPENTGWTPYTSMEALAEVCPAMLTAPHVMASSSGSNVTYKGKPWRVFKGFHRYVPVLDASDVPRALKALHVRLVLAGHHYTKLSKNGAGLVRSPVDVAMDGPSQPVYHRAHLLHRFLKQNRDVHIMLGHACLDDEEVYPEGDWLLDTRAAIADLTPSELADFDMLEAKLETAAEATPEAAELRAGRVAALMKRTGKTEAEAKASLANADKGDLGPDYVLVMGDGKALTVAELLEPGNAFAYDKKYCCDPEEPEAGPSKAFLQLQQDQPFLNCFLHGGRGYRLHATPESYARAVARALPLPTVEEMFDDQPEGVTGKEAKEEERAAAAKVAAEAKAKMVAGYTPTFITADLLGRASLAPPCIVENLLWAEVGFMAAAGGTGKTTVTCLIGVCIATGRDLFGLRVNRPGRFVYVTVEDRGDLIMARVREIGRAMRLSDAEWEQVYGNFAVLDLSDVGLKLTTESRQGIITDENTDVLIEALAGLEASMIVLDPAVSLGVGEAQVNDAEQGLIAACRRIQRKTGACVYLIHHTGKVSARSKADDQYAGRGGSAMADGARMVHILTPLDASAWKELTGRGLDPSEAGLKLSRPKSSPAPLQPDIVLSRKGYSFDVVESIDPAAAKEKRLQANQAKLWGFLQAEKAGGHLYSLRDLIDQPEIIGLSVRELKAAGAALRIAGLVTNDKKPGKAAGTHTYLNPKDEEADPFGGEGE